MSRVIGVGYEGRSVEELVDLISRAGVTVLVDVRQNAVSRKPGLSKSGLAERLGAAGIRYEHMPMLGNPKDNREAFRNGEPAARSRYREILSNGSNSHVDRLIELTSSEAVGLLCFERNAGQCHRTEVIEEMQRREPSITVCEL